MAKHRRARPQVGRVEGLSAGARGRTVPQPQGFVDDFTGEVVRLRPQATPHPRSALAPVSGDVLHQLAQVYLGQAADAVLQRAGLAPRPPQVLGLGEAVQRAAIVMQTKHGTRR